MAGFGLLMNWGDTSTRGSEYGDATQAAADYGFEAVLDYSWKTRRISMLRAANRVVHYMRQQIMEAKRWFGYSRKMRRISMLRAANTVVHYMRRQIVDTRR
jgi:hypothetical protein